jgi:hypothetical protein
MAADPETYEQFVDRTMDVWEGWRMKFKAGYDAHSQEFDDLIEHVHLKTDPDFDIDDVDDDNLEEHMQRAGEYINAKNRREMKKWKPQAPQAPKVQKPKTIQDINDMYANLFGEQTLNQMKDRIRTKADTVKRLNERYLYEVNYRLQFLGQHGTDGVKKPENIYTWEDLTKRRDEAAKQLIDLKAEIFKEINVPFFSNEFKREILRQIQDVKQGGLIGGKDTLPANIITPTIHKQVYERLLDDINRMKIEVMPEKERLDSRKKSWARTRYSAIGVQKHPDTGEYYRVDEVNADSIPFLYYDEMHNPPM